MDKIWRYGGSDSIIQLIGILERVNRKIGGKTLFKELTDIISQMKKMKKYQIKKTHRLPGMVGGSSPSMKIYFMKF